MDRSRQSVIADSSSHTHISLCVTECLPNVQEHVGADVSKARGVVREELEALEVVAVLHESPDAIEGVVPHVLARKQVNAVAIAIKGVHLERGRKERSEGGECQIARRGRGRDGSTVPCASIRESR